MKNATEYLNHVKALIVLHPQISHWQTVREETVGDKGLFRYRLTLQDGSLLEAFEYFQITAEKVQTEQYS